MKHKHYDMIVAKAANMDLETFINQDGEWRLMVNAFPMSEHFEYFLCLPQHKDACLHWLNGGEVEENYDSVWGDIGQHSWHDQSVFNFDDGYTIRIKPKKEKRWIGYCASRNQTIPHPQESEQLAMDYTALHYSYHVNEWQFIEIEVEV